MNISSIKYRAKRMISENRGYYFGLTLIPTLISYFILTIGYLGVSRGAQLANENMDVLQSLRLFYGLTTAAVGVGIIVQLVQTLFNFSVQTIMLKSYREEPLPDSGIKASFSVFEDKKWLFVIGIFILSVIYQAIVDKVFDIFTTFGLAVLTLIRGDANNGILNFIFWLGLIVLTIVFFIANILVMNFISQVAYTFADGFKKGEGIFYAFRRSFYLMTQAYYMKKFFYLQLSFIGWSLLNVLTFGILGLCWLNAYTQLTYAGFYDEMSN